MNADNAPAHQPLLAIVPARAGSRGVIRKNMREVGGRPLIAHTIAALQQSGIATRLVVSTDDEAVMGWASLNGVECLPRPEHLARPDTTIAQVAAHVADTLDWHGTVGVFQPTSPRRTAASLGKALTAFRDSSADSLASAARDQHLYWYQAPGADGPPTPLFHERTNRQYATHALFRETGAIQFVRSETLRSTTSMVGTHHVLFEMPDDENEDIDTPSDLEAVRHTISRGTIVFRLSANRTIGSGHLHHCLQLAEYLDTHRVEFLLDDCDPHVADTLARYGWSYRTETNLASDLQALRHTGPHLIVNDVLDTTTEDILAQKAAGYTVVTIEDLGPGSRYADLVINALYVDGEHQHHRVLSGAKYATLRSEFFGLPPKPIRDDAHRILVTFGGSDPNNLAERVLAAIGDDPAYDITVVLGATARAFTVPDRVTLKRDIRSMAAEMHAADVVITAAGRTIYEAAAVGTPVIAIAQNAREATHSHLSLDSGVLFLGIGLMVTDQEIRETTKRLMDNPALRRDLSARLAASVDLLGAQRIAHHIEGLLRGLS